MFSIKIIDKRVSNEHGTFGISNIEIFLEIFGAQNFPVLDRNARKPMLEYKLYYTTSDPKVWTNSQNLPPRG